VLVAAGGCPCGAGPGPMARFLRPGFGVDVTCVGRDVSCPPQGEKPLVSDPQRLSNRMASLSERRTRWGPITFFLLFFLQKNAQEGRAGPRGRWRCMWAMRVPRFQDVPRPQAWCAVRDEQRVAGQAAACQRASRPGPAVGAAVSGVIPLLAALPRQLTLPRRVPRCTSRWSGR